MAKAGHRADEYEDAFAADPLRGRFAIADGASESAFAVNWAKILVNAFVQNPGSWSSWLVQARELWKLQAQERELAWYAETKVQEGAYAAVLGISITNGHWTASAVGDCCLFQVRAQRLFRVFPMRRSADFSSRPALLGSRRRAKTQPRTPRLHVQGNWRTGDVFFLMSDALAQWALKKFEKGKQPWGDLQSINDNDQFAQWISKLRQAKDLTNDDVTLLLIRSKTTVHESPKK
jgi:hypothetical protein